MSLDKGAAPTDHVDQIRAQWAREMPDVDTSAVAIVGRVRRLAKRVSAINAAVFKCHGLDAGEFDVLATLRRSGAPCRLSPTELNQSLMISSGGLADRLARLERAGLVRRLPSPDDGRSLLAELTKEGAERIEAALREDMAHEVALVAGLSAEDQAALATLLRRLILSIGE